jgi:hypothetical protein
MPDLKALLRKASTGGMAEEARKHLTAKLDDHEQRLANQMEAALRDGNDHQRMILTAKWSAWRELRRELEQEIAAGHAAQREM